MRLDGVDVQRLDLLWLRTQFGYVAQHPALFDSSVAYNVALALGARPRRAGEEALRATAPPNSSTSCPAVPKQPSVKAAAGCRVERQRVAVARALARNAPVLLWDEAASSLDGASERLVHDACGSATCRRGVGRAAAARALVAHRLSTVLCAEGRGD